MCPSLLKEERTEREERTDPRAAGAVLPIRSVRPDRPKSGAVFEVLGNVRAALSALRHPVHPETRLNLRRIDSRLSAATRTREQMYGRHFEGCGAIIGAMPRCDFTCSCCYLGSSANRTPPLPLEALEGQLRLLRAEVGRWGNLQLTDGEITLRPAEDLIALLCTARSIQLIPMIMTHGDTFLRQPDLLARLVVEGGLSEVSFHVDTTQRGRRQRKYRDATSEAQLNPLRDEFAQLVRKVRRETGKPLHAATTVTVTHGNLSGVAGVVRWAQNNADAFRMVSFQPVADVGRTQLTAGVGGAELWERVGEGLLGSRAEGDRLRSSRVLVGHPDCTSFVPGMVAIARGGEPLYQPLFDPSVPGLRSVADRFVERWGGLTFRPDSRLVAFARGLGLLAGSPALLLGQALPCAVRRLGRLGPRHSLPRLITGRARLHPLSIVSHHFMSREEAESPQGRERLSACVFRVPCGDRLVSMCEANALGLRDRYYEDLRAGREPGRSIPTHTPG